MGSDRIEVILHGTDFSGKYVLLRFKNAGDNEWMVLKAKA
jgi:bifunctional non-homologous end joining protein LigD